MRQAIFTIPKPTTLTIPFCPNRPGVKAFGTSSSGLIRTGTGRQAVSVHPYWLNTTRHAVKVFCRLYWWITVSIVVLIVESPSPNIHLYRMPPVDRFVNISGVLTTGGIG